MTPRIASSLVVVVATFAALPAAAADPTKEQCIAANDHAQESRQAGKLGKAREQLVVCVSQSCPGPVREDCAQRLDEVDKAMPTIVFEVKDASGNDVAAVTVKMDGQPFAQKVGGAAVAIDPGEHHFVFEAAGSSTEKTVVVREAEKDRRERVVLGATSAAAPGPGQAPASVGASDGSMQRMIGLVVGGAGVVGLVLGGVFGLVSKSTYNNAIQNECGNNPNTCSTQGAQDGQSAHSQATISTVGFIAGAALLGGGAVLYFTAPKGSSVGVAPTVGTAGGGLSVVGAW